METLLTSIGAFIGTNIDDILILAFIFSANSGVKMHKIVLGKYLGMAVLSLFSILSALGLKLIDEKYIFLLGFVPVILGIKEIISNIKTSESENIQETKGGILSTAFITVAGGGDNLGVYIPLFASFGFWETLLCLTVFAAFTLLWCFLGKFIATLPKIKGFIEKYKAVIIPAVYFALGLYIFLK